MTSAKTIKDFLNHEVIIRPMYVFEHVSGVVDIPRKVMVADVCDIETAVVHKGLWIFTKLIVKFLEPLLTSELEGCAGGTVEELNTKNQQVVLLLREFSDPQARIHAQNVAKQLGWDEPISLSERTGRLVQDTRVRKGTSQETIARVLNIPVEDMEGIEDGSRPVTLEQIVLIAKYLGVAPRDIVPIGLNERL